MGGAIISTEAINSTYEENFLESSAEFVDDTTHVGNQDKDAQWSQTSQDH